MYKKYIYIVLLVHAFYYVSNAMKSPIAPFICQVPENLTIEKYTDRSSMGFSIEYYYTILSTHESDHYLILLEDPKLSESYNPLCAINITEGNEFGFIYNNSSQFASKTEFCSWNEQQGTRFIFLVFDKVNAQNAHNWLERLDILSFKASSADDLKKLNS